MEAANKVADKVADIVAYKRKKKKKKNDIDIDIIHANPIW